MFGVDLSLSSCLQWLGETKSPSQVLLGAAFSFNAGVAILKRFREELNQRLILAIHSEVNVARSSGWLASLELLEQVSSCKYREAAMLLMAECNHLDAQPLGFVVWVTRISKALMIFCAAIALVCMAVPCTARWTVLLFFPYPLFVIVANAYEWRKLKKFEKLRERVKVAYEQLPEEDKQLLRCGAVAEADVKKVLKGKKSKKR